MQFNIIAPKSSLVKHFFEKISYFMKNKSKIFSQNPSKIENLQKLYRNVSFVFVNVTNRTHIIFSSKKLSKLRQSETLGDLLRLSFVVQ